jgi:hypothetical protein
MKTSTIVNSLNILIIITIIIAICAVVAVAMTIAQSASYISLGQFSPNITGKIAIVDVPVTIGNHGYLALADINVRLSLKDSNGTTLVDGFGGPLTIHAGSTDTFVITIRINTTNITPELLQSLMYNDQNLTINASLGEEIQPLMRLTASASAFFWGAPIKDLTTGTLQLTIFNTSHARLTLPFNFKDNSAFLPVQGTLTGTILLANGTEIGTVDAYTLNVSPGATLSGNLAGYIKNEAVGQPSCILRLTFQITYGSVSKEVILHA